MSIRYYRRIPLVPGLVWLNLSTRGWSVTIGVRGLRFTIGPGRSSVSAGLPGTGLSWRKRLK